MTGPISTQPCDLLLVLRYRKAVTYGHHALLAALDEYPSTTRFDVRFAESAAATVDEIAEGVGRARRVLVLWSFHSPDAPAMAAELAQVRRESAVRGIDTATVRHVAGGVHATAEPARTLAAGWDVAAVGEGESTIRRLVDAGGEPAGITGLVYRDPSGAMVRTGRPERLPLDTFRAFPLGWNRFNAIEITRGCVHSCRYCQASFMFSARFRHRSVGNVRWHVDQMRQRGLRDVRFVTPSAMSYGSDGTTANLAAVEELLASCKEGIGRDGRVFLGTFPSEIRPEHVSVEALRLVRRYCANTNIIVGAQSGSDRVLETAKRGHTVEAIRRAVRIGVEQGFRINVDMIFGMPGEGPAEAAASLALVRELAELGARIHAHTFMPLPGTPWREAPPGDVDPQTARHLDQLAQAGALYGHWQRQRDRAAELAEAALANPRPGRSRTLPPAAQRR